MKKRQADQPIRVLIVEDSNTQRELIVRILESTTNFVVVGTASNGKEGLERTLSLQPDVVTMDIHMPVLNGYEATRLIMQQCPTPIVMVSSSFGDEGRHSVEALAVGALAIIRKPGGPIHAEYAQDRENLLRTLRLMADVPVITRYPSRESKHLEPKINTLPLKQTPRLLAIAASTGGPGAIHLLLNGLGPDFPLPILLVQHIARGFVAAMVDWLNSTVSLDFQITRYGEKLLPGHVYLAPDDQHLMAGNNSDAIFRPNSAQDRYCPSADILFDSVARIYGNQAIGVILTGMGDDGAIGLRTLHDAGGYTLAQDEASCVVYGMPQAAVLAGAVTRVEPLTNLAPYILQKVGSGPSGV
jgi:two-component system chemotaxis response regulator CheB